MDGTVEGVDPRDVAPWLKYSIVCIADVFRTAFSKHFGHRKLFSQVNIHGTHMLCGHSFFNKGQSSDVCY
jgi:hypothetical protein